LSEQIYSLDDVSKQLNIPKSCLVCSHWTMRKQVWKWAEDCDIKIEYQGSELFSISDIWYVPIEEHRIWFKLRWQ
jgi:hypothetical protein